MPYTLPDSGWPMRKKFQYAVERLKAESRRDEETTLDYWLAGLMINEIKKDRKANGEWVAYLAENGLTRTRAHHAAQIAAAFQGPEELAGLTKTEARRAAAVKIRHDREAARLAKGLPPASPRPSKPVPLVKSVEVTAENAWAILEQAAELMEASAMEARNTTADPEIVKDVTKRLRGVLEHLKPLIPGAKAYPASRPKRVHLSGAQKRKRKAALAAEQEKAGTSTSR